ncbi:hypothetical protein RJ641_021455 [Dillenia turbinata]|uniref:Uncharacterized protein n=1 Tax=Dillenia turbinata TaxID=194707 RepID=A0AAN8UJW3_9MAGN
MEESKVNLVRRLKEAKRHSGKSYSEKAEETGLTNVVFANRVPKKVQNIHQLKKESLWAFSFGSNSSNWSAPMVDMLGLVPPVPMGSV